ncbi:sensor histidine kinase [Flavobacterium sp. '19STA2R22 D10 B1']|uniref:tetratricopeptide repeat-containing sensor histidine kinase n=1 Tax=Flavobacterium aerium TaxID=3037261 RepID=UPI00278C0AEB|nr:sensor histidine kinase [Flavobacterium sp. '19STA2R22 D10 B1']
MLQAQSVYTLDDDKPFRDSLTMLIKSTKSDSLKCINSFKLSEIYRRSKNAELSNEYRIMANEIAPKYKFLKAVAILYNATDYLLKGDIKGYGNQLTLANGELKKFPIKEAYVIRATILKNQSILKQMESDEKGAMRILVEEAMPLAVKGEDYEVVSSIYKSLGIISMNALEREKANDYLNKAIEYIDKASKASYTYEESKLETYIIKAENLLELGRYEEAKKALDITYSILRKYPQSNLNGSFYYAQGLYYSKTNQLEESIKSYDKGIINSDYHHNILLRNRLNFAKYLPLKKLGRYAEARDLLEELLNNENILTIDKKNYNKELASVYEKLGDTKNAYKYSSQYITLSDSLNASEYREEIAALEAKFNKSENEKKISQLEAHKERASLIAENNKLYYGLLVAVLFILVLLVLILWRNSKNQKKMALEHRKNYDQNLTNLKNQKEIDVMQAMIRGEEAERKRIARDLHDGIGSMLSSLKMRFIKVNTALDTVNADEIENMNTLLNNSITELRQVSYNLIPESLLKLGLEHALNDLCHILNTNDIQIEFQSNKIENTIPESAQITIYRIVQELLNNALKHANCTTILVDCSQNQDRFFITIEDNGVGFDIDKMGDFQGLGLKNLKNRVDLLNGKIEIDSTPETGTAINIELTV